MNKITRRELFGKFLDLSRLSLLRLRLVIRRPLPGFVMVLLRGLDSLAQRRQA